MLSLFKENLIFGIFFLNVPIVVGIVLKISKWLDDAFGKGDVAQQIPDYLRKLKINKPFSSFLISSVYLSDIIYGKKIISFRAFLTSSIVTFLFFIIFCITLVLKNPHSWLSISIIKKLVWEKFSYLMIFGIFIDYFSISLTRYIFNWSSKKNIKVQVVSVFLDFVFSIFLFSILFFICKSIILSQNILYENVFNILTNQIIEWFKYPSELSLQLVTLDDWYIYPNGKIEGGKSEIIYAFPEGILFFSSLFTSFFGIVFLLASILYKCTSKLDKLKSFLLKQSASDKPIFCATIILLTTVFLPFSIFIIIFMGLISIL